MKDRYIPAVITLIAGAVVSGLNIINKVEMLAGLKRLLLVLLIFYVIGLIARAIIKKATTKTPPKENKGTEELQEEKLGESVKSSKG
ncbi:MAG: hypothetical protein K0S47_1959 [Herbinix sp.]|nr:hypothetical protein [Herbinix sp.]